jgi:hypothetical protein
VLLESHRAHRGHNRAWDDAKQLGNGNVLGSSWRQGGGECLSGHRTGLFIGAKAWVW